MFVFYTEEGSGDARTPLTVALNYQQFSVVKVLIDAGANINKPVRAGNFHDEVPLRLTLFEGRMEFIRLLIGSGSDVTSGDWNGAIGLNLDWPGHASTAFCKEFLILFMQAGGTINVGHIIGHNQDWSDHMGGFGRPVHVDEELQMYRDGSLYKFNILDMCRIVIRKKLIEHAQGKSILPAIKSLPLPMKMKSFLSFGCVSEQ